MRRAVGVAVVMLVATTVSAEICQVPSGSYPTIQDAVDAPICTEIELAAQSFVESVVIARDLVVRGLSSGSTVIEGRVEVYGATTQAVIEELKIDGSASSVAGSFAQALVSEGGAELTVSGVVVVNGSLLFGDGFETGGTTRWSATAP
jgi:hypothetical protein